MRFEFDEKAFLRSRRLLLSYRSLGPDILRCRGPTHLKSALSSFRHDSWRVHIDQFRVLAFQCAGHNKGRKLLRRCRRKTCRSHVSGGPTQCRQSSIRPRSPMLLSARVFSATSSVSLHSFGVIKCLITFVGEHGCGVAHFDQAHFNQSLQITWTDGR